MNALIKSNFWTQEELENASSEVKLAALWLCTNPARDAAGFTRVSARRFTFETGLDPAVLNQVVRLPQYEKFDDGTFWVVGFVQHQCGNGDKLLKNNMTKGCIRALEALPRACQARFYGEYPELISFNKDKNLQPLQRGAEPQDRIGEDKYSSNQNINTVQSVQTLDLGELNVDPGLVNLARKVDQLCDAWANDRTDWRKYGVQQQLLQHRVILEALSVDDWRILRWHYIQASNDRNTNVTFSRLRFLESISANIARSKSDYSAAGKPSLHNVNRAEVAAA